MEKLLVTLQAPHQGHVDEGAYLGSSPELVGVYLKLTNVPHWEDYSCILLVNESKDCVTFVFDHILLLSDSGRECVRYTVDVKPSDVVYLPTSAYTNDIDKYCEWYNKWLSSHTDVPESSIYMLSPWTIY